MSYYLRYEKNWESTYRLTDTTPFYPNHFGPTAEIYLQAVYASNSKGRYPGKYRQMIAEGNNKIRFSITLNFYRINL